MGHVVRLGTTPGSWPPITRVLGHVSFLPIWQVKSPLGQAVCSLLAHGRAAKVAPLKRPFLFHFAFLTSLRSACWPGVPALESS